MVEIDIRRNLIASSSGLSNGIVRIMNNSSNIVISQNFIQNIGSTIDDGITVQAGSALIEISNNFIFADRNAINSSAAAQIHNNILEGDLTVIESKLTNNILRSGNFLGANSQFSNNMANEAQFGTDDGNLSVDDMEEVFVTSGTTDGRLQLAENSPARSSGFEGVDMGIFGGPTPYVLSGLPAIPAIYFFSAPGVGTEADGLRVRLKVKSHD